MGMQPFPAQPGIHRNLEAYKHTAPSLSARRLNPAEGRKQNMDESVAVSRILPPHIHILIVSWINSF